MSSDQARSTHDVQGGTISPPDTSHALPETSHHPATRSGESPPHTSEPATREQEASDYEEGSESGFTPRGTLLFLMVMLLGYALYWAYLWFIVVIERGAGGV